MSQINLVYIIPLLLTLILVGYSLFLGRKEVKKNQYRYLILPAVLSILVGTLVINQYYEKQLQAEREELSLLLLPSQISDSLYTNAELRKSKIDSLESENKKLLELLSKVKKKETVLGDQSNIKKEINNKVKTNQVTIGVIEKYNEILDKSLIEKWQGHSFSGNTSNFIFQCPDDFTSEYLDLKLQFQDESLLTKIAYIYISFVERKSEKKYYLLFDQIYRPQEGVNAFKVKNYFQSGKQVDLEIGYILKSEINKDFPRFEKVTCKNY